MHQGVGGTFLPYTDDKTLRRSWGTHPSSPISFKKTLLSDFGANIQIYGAKIQIYGAKIQSYSVKTQICGAKIQISDRKFK